MNHVALCCDCQLRSYRDGWLIIRLKKITGDFFQTLEVNAVLIFVLFFERFEL